jgi:DNA polymerase elongation subunit (family B)
MQVIPFGKHANKLLPEVPSDYLNWMIKTINDKPDLIEAVKSELKKRKNLKNVYDSLIFGKDSTEYIVNVTINQNGANVFFKDGTSKVIPYKPWALGPYEATNAKRLEGEQHYKFIKEYDYDFYVTDFLDNKPYEIFTPRSVEEGFMMCNGFTYFKGMKTEDASLLSFDIETTTTNAELPGSEVVLISNTFRKNGIITRRLFDIQDYKFNQIQMIDAWETWVREVNPDILLGHNIFSFDLPYLNTIKPLKLGRDGSEIYVEPQKSKFRKDGSQQYEYNNMKIFGREICDTYFLSIKYDISRHFPSYGLKAIEKHLKLVDESRIEWDFTKNSVKTFYKTNDSLWQEFKEYCRQDGDSPIKMFDIMAPSFFYMNQSVPKTFQQMINEATGSQLDSIMIRSYLQDGHSIASSSKKVEFEGAISLGVAGVYKNVFKQDLIALYPSIMLQYEIYDKDKDPKQNLLKILKYVRTERIKNKDLYKKTKNKYYDDLQGSQKIFANSLYGYLGSGYLLYNSPENAAKITRLGRETLEKAIKFATNKDVTYWRELSKEKE